MFKILGITVLLQALGYFFQFFGFFLFAKVLGSENQGILSLFRATGQVIASLISVGLPGAIIYFVGKNKNLFSSTTINCLKFAFVMLPFLGLFLWILPLDISVKAYLVRGYIPHILIFVLVLSSYEIFEVSILSLREYFLYNLFTFGAGIIVFVFSALIWYLPDVANKLNLSIVAYLTAYGLMSIYGAMIFLSERRKIGGIPAKQSLWEQFRVGLRGFISNVGGLLLFRIDLFIVGYFLSIREVGIYSIALFGTEMITKIPNWSAAILTPMVASGEVGHVKRTVYLFYSAIILAFLFGLVFFFVNAIFSDFISSLIGKDFGGVETCLLLLLPRVIMQSGISILAANLAGKGYPWYHPLGCAIPLVFLVLLDIVLVPKLGINGAALGGSLAHVSAFIIFLIGFRKYNQISNDSGFKSYWVMIRGLIHC